MDRPVARHAAGHNLLVGLRAACRVLALVVGVLTVGATAASASDVWFDYGLVSGNSTAHRSYQSIYQTESQGNNYDSCTNMWNQAGYYEFSNWSCAGGGYTASTDQLNTACTCQAYIKANTGNADNIWAWEYVS